MRSGWVEERWVGRVIADEGGDSDVSIQSELFDSVDVGPVGFMRIRAEGVGYACKGDVGKRESGSKKRR